MKKYKVVLSNNIIYKEIELTPEMQQVRVGTGNYCDIRLNRDLFYEEFELFFVEINENWVVTCSNNLCLLVDEFRKLKTKDLDYGDNIKVNYESSDSLLFAMEFNIDFADGIKQYERQINLSNVVSFKIGAAKNCEIEIHGEFISNDLVILTRTKEGFALQINDSTYGVYINGLRAKTNDILKNTDFLSISDYFFYFKDDRIWTQMSDEMIIKNLDYIDVPNKNEYPKFNRNTRVKSVVSSEDITILDPPSVPQKPKSNFAQSVLRVVMMMVMVAFMISIRGGGMAVMMVFSAISGLLMTIFTYFDNKRSYKKNCAERIEKYNNYINNKRKDIESIRNDEKQILNKIYLSQDDEQKLFDEFSPKLFDRARDDEDFLAIKLGNGSIKAKRNIKYKGQERIEIEDELQLVPEKVSEQYRYIENAPVICDLKANSAVGIVGPILCRYNIFKNIIVDIIARHYFKDVKMVFIAEKKNEDKINWLRMLPHVYVENQKIKTVVTDDESKNIVFEYLYNELTRRQSSKEKGNFAEHIVIFFFDEYGFKNHPISKFVKNAKQLGVTFVFFGDERKDIPLGCDSIINLEDGRNGELISAKDGQDKIDFKYEPLSDNATKKIVDLMTPVYGEEISLEGALTKNISLFKMLDIADVEDLDLKERYRTSNVTKSMAAPIGVTKSDIVKLDLNDHAHGPHGLVAGTTGSGKSEILQTYILSMATLFEPDEVGFMIIDFKGGGMGNQFKDLPHLLGNITNIDGKEINRSLKSIRAELHKREALFKEADVNHIDKYINKRKKDKSMVAIPHLIIIVDEFAELKAEQPEFMKELISAARIGRSLGVHLILATQKPSGQVDDQIWSNSRFKLCLKVQSQSDSNEVIKSPLAAEIKEPGRAYLQVGNNEIFELFQSAYSGAPEKTDDARIKKFRICSVSQCGKRSVVHESKNESNGENKTERTQLMAMVDYIAKYCEDAHLQKLPDICMPPLANLLAFPKKISYRNNNYGIGIYDDPDNQIQAEVMYDFDSNNTVITGASQTGKTNFLQMLIRNISSTKKANEANIYIMDFGSMILKNFEGLNHVGGVALPFEEEKVKNLFKLLGNEVATRKEKLLKIGVSSISSYYESGHHDLPRIYVLIDNLDIFKEIYAEKYEDDLLFIAREGNAYGISIIMTSTAGNLNYKYLSNFANRVTFTSINSNEYSNMFDHCRLEPSNLPGRMLVSLNKTVYEAQSYLSFEGEKEIERIETIKQYIAEQNAINEGLHAKKIPSVPNRFSQEDIMSNYDIDLNKEIAVGLSYKYVEPVRYYFTVNPQLSIISKLKANLLGFEKALLNEVEYNYFDRQSNVYIVDSIGRDLKEYEDRPYVSQYSTDYTSIEGIIEELKIELYNRYEEVIASGRDILNSKPLLYVLINNREAIDYLSKDKHLCETYKELVSKYKEMKFIIVLGAIEDEKYNSLVQGPIIKTIKESKDTFILTNVTQHKFFDFMSSSIKQYKKPLEETEGYYYKDDEIVKFRFAKDLKNSNKI